MKLNKEEQTLINDYEKAYNQYNKARKQISNLNVVEWLDNKLKISLNSNFKRLEGAEFWLNGNAIDYTYSKDNIVIHITIYIDSELVSFYYSTAGTIEIHKSIHFFEIHKIVKMIKKINNIIRKIK